VLSSPVVSCHVLSSVCSLLSCADLPSACSCVPALTWQVKGLTAEACDCSTAQQGTAAAASKAATAAAAPGGIFSRVLRAVAPWNDEM
jgi:hypothetical protein